MQKYAKVIDEETGACIVGLGESESAAEYYTTLGMELLDVFDACCAQQGSDSVRGA